MNFPDPYDLVVIGGGPAGEKAAAQAAYWGKRVALVERRPVLGGTMAGGAVASKTMREAALYLTSFQGRDVYDVGLDLSPAVAMARLRSRTDGVAEAVTNGTAANMSRHRVDVVPGHGRLGVDRTVIVTGGPSDVTLQGEVVLLAPGSRAYRPSGVPFDGTRVLDADEAARLEEPLSQVAVVGGGAVGCEFASIFLALGAEVTLVDSGPRLLPFVDEELADLLAATFRARGMRVVQNEGRADVERLPDGVAVVLKSGERLRTEAVILATGRAGNTSDLFLDRAGVDVDERGRIIVDARFRTTAAGVYAAGDVVGPPALASVSMEQARVAMCWAFDLPLKRDLEELAPFGVYAIPEVAMVGMTERAAAAVGIDYVVGRSDFSGNTRSLIAGATDGLLKLVARRDDHRLLGVHILGSAATELIHLGQAALHFHAGIEYFIHTTFNVPTLTEAYKYAAYDALGAAERE